MDRRTRFKVLWTVWMTGGGIATGVIVYATSHSVGWTIVGVLASGVVLNAIGQALVQPIKAGRGVRGMPTTTGDRRIDALSRVRKGAK